MEKDNGFMLPRDFFERDEVIRIESLQGGKTFLLMLVNLFCKFAGNGGKIAEDERETSAEKVILLIARVTRTELITARIALKLFLETGFIYERDGNLYLKDMNKCSGRQEGGATGGE